MKVRIRIDCTVEMDNPFLPEGVALLDVIEKGVKVLKATKIYPGAKLSMNRPRR